MKNLPENSTPDGTNHAGPRLIHAGLPSFQCPPSKVYSTHKCKLIYIWGGWHHHHPPMFLWSRCSHWSYRVRRAKSCEGYTNGAGRGGIEIDVEKSISLKEINNADRIYDTNLNLKITDFLQTLTLPKSFALCQISLHLFFPSSADGVRLAPIKKNW